MTSETILSVEPRLPPAMCGTSTYGWALSQNWPEPRPRFVHVVVDGAEASRRYLGTDEIVETGESAARLCKALERHSGAGAIVHYASRGYHRYGFPLWFGRGILRWRKRNPQTRLLAYFHEVPGQFPLRSRFGIIEWLNRGVMRRLAGAASEVITNTPEHAQRLMALSGRRSVEWLPVPSNVPVPAHPDSSFSARQRGDFVIFGLSFTRLLTVRIFEKHLSAWRAAGLLERLHLIGPDDEKFSPQTQALLGTLLPAECIVRHGTLEPEAVSAVLQRAGFCLTYGTADNFSKSGTLMAFAAHGCATVAKIECAADQAPLRDFIEPRELLQAGASGDFSEIERKTRSLRQWYVLNADWPVVARRIELAFAGKPA